MQTPVSNSPRQNIKSNVHKTRPDIRDNLDSRANEEQDFKGDDVTYNTKPHHSIKAGKKI